MPLFLYTKGNVALVTEFYLVFSLDKRRYALPASDVVRVSLAAELTDPPAELRTIRGVANVGGEAAPVADLRPRKDALFPEMKLSDRFVFFRDKGVLWGVIAEKVEGVMALSTALFSAESGEMSSGGEEAFEMAFPDPEKPGILVRNPENMLLLTEAELVLLDSILSGER
ncbi:MAG: chemotaxis protein CheW [Aminivibrio sp.]|jgi:chemotaxis signal transduction protein